MNCQTPISDSTKPYIQPVVDGPWLFGLFGKIPALIQNSKMLYSGVGDKEQNLDAKIRILSGVPAILYSAMDLSRYAVFGISKLTTASTPFLNVVLPWTGVVGLVVCALEGAFNLIQMQRTDRASTLPSIVFLTAKEKKEDKATVLFRKLSELKTTYYIENGKTLTPKNGKLATRLQPWCDKRIAEQLPSILDHLNSSLIVQSEGIAEAEELLSVIQTQIQKTQFFHALSILCLAVCSTAFIGGLVCFPPLAAFALAFVGGFASFGVTLTAGAYFSEEGWHCDKEYFLHDWINKYLFKIDLDAQEKYIAKAANTQWFDYKTTLSIASKIRSPNEKAKALYTALTQAKKRQEEKSTLDEIAQRIEKLSIFYHHKAEQIHWIDSQVAL